MFRQPNRADANVRLRHANVTVNLVVINEESYSVVSLLLVIETASTHVLFGQLFIIH